MTLQISALQKSNPSPKNRVTSCHCIFLQSQEQNPAKVLEEMTPQLLPPRKTTIEIDGWKMIRFLLKLPLFSGHSFIFRGVSFVLQVRHRWRIVFRVDAVTIHLVLGARISHGAGYMNPKQHLRSQHLPGGKYTYIYIYIHCK